MSAIKFLDHSVSLRALFTASALATGCVATPAQAQNACELLPGGIIDCSAPVPPPPGSPPGTPPTTGSIDLTGSLDPLTVTLADGFVSNGPFTLGTLAGADIDIVSEGVSTIDATGSGLVVDSSGAINAQISNVSTVADGATGALLTAADEAIFTSDGVIETVGDSADGVNITGSNVTADLNVVRTEGLDAQGVEILSTDGPISLDFDLVETEGGLSDATVLRGTGDVTLSGRALRTGGTDAVGFDVSTDAAACILLGAGGCDVTAAVEEVTTDGFGGIGGLVAATGDTDVDIGVLRTGGDEAAGLDLSADPDACVTLGVGACDTAFTVGELTTSGARSPGAIVRGAGDITAHVGVLRTGGDEAAGLDLASDPAACAVLGAGACDTSFSVGELTTSGAGATGILVRAAGDTTGDVGVVRTQGDDAAGIDIAGDPTACVLVGAGACDVGLVADEVSTQGEGAAAVLIDTPGDVIADLGRVTTLSDGSTGLGIFTDPAACLALGPGSCTIRAAADDVETDGEDSPAVEVDGGEDPIDVDVGEVDTSGDDSPGIDIDGTGPITVDAGDVTTGGDDSPGILVSGDDDPVAVSCASVTTAGANAAGVAIAAEGAIRLRCGRITTTGPNSDGVLIDGGSGLVDLEVGPVTTSGDGSDGIDVATADGDQRIVAGPIAVTGARARGIRAVATGCGDVSITARDDISSADGAGILASSACGVAVTTLDGADVSGRTGGIDVTSGTGATIRIGGDATSEAGPAIAADGGGATILVDRLGSISGSVDLTDNADSLTNEGLFAPVGTSNFGAAADLLVNAGTLQARGAPLLEGLESFVNRGLIDLGDGAADDQLSLSGDLSGEAGSRLAIDVVGASADRLVVGGNVGGTTQVSLNLVGPALANPTGTVIVDAASAAGTPFALAGPTRAGFVDFSLRQTGGDTLLVALPNAFAAEPLLIGRIGQDFWYQSADAWSESAELRRANLGSEAPRGTSFWVQGYGGGDRQGGERDLDLLGNAVTANLRYETDRRGVQGGVDLRLGETTGLGVTGGYEHAMSDLASGTRAMLEGYNVGAYFLYGSPRGFYAELLAKADFFDAGLVNGSLFGDGAIDGHSYGAEGELGYRMPTGSLHIDVGAGLAYVRTSLDTLEASGFRFDFDRAESLRGRIGVRVGGTGSLSPYADVKLLHEFGGDNRTELASGGFATALIDEGRGTWVRGEVGLTGSADRSGGFVSAWGETGDVDGYGLRLGFRW